jgi:hypothetical protein
VSAGENKGNKGESKKLIEDASRLPPEARAALAGILIESLDGAVDPDAEAAWSKEIARRFQELEQGSTPSIPWSHAQRTLSQSAAPH